MGEKCRRKRKWCSTLCRHTKVISTKTEGSRSRNIIMRNKAQEGRNRKKRKQKKRKKKKD
jgi:hypothetical protein